MVRFKMVRFVNKTYSKAIENKFALQKQAENGTVTWLDALCKQKLGKC